MSNIREEQGAGNLHFNNLWSLVYICRYIYYNGLAVCIVLGVACLLSKALMRDRRYTQRHGKQRDIRSNCRKRKNSQRCKRDERGDGHKPLCPSSVCCHLSHADQPLPHRLALPPTEGCVHRNISCDACGTSPLRGTRYKVGECRALATFLLTSRGPG